MIKKYMKLLMVSFIVGLGLVVFGAFREKAAAYPPADIQVILQNGCPASLSSGYSYATGFIYPNPSTVLSSSGGTNLYAAAHICPGSAATGVTGVVLKMESIARTSGTGNLQITPPIQFSPVSTDTTTYSHESGAIWVNFDSLSPGYNCWHYSMTMSIGGPGIWGEYTTGGNSLCIQYTPPPAGTIYTTKYFPDNHFANGVVSGQPADVNNALVCLTNIHNVKFNCSSANSWAAGGILTSDNDYRVSVNVPANYRLTRATVKGFSRSLTCTGVSNTGTCYVSVTVTENINNYIDFWFEVDNPPFGEIFTSACNVGDFNYINRSGNHGSTEGSIVGRVQDPDYSVGRVHAYMDGPAGVGTRIGGDEGNYYGDKYPTDDSVNGRPIINKGAYGSDLPNRHDWFVIPRDVLDDYDDAYVRQVYIYFIGLDKDGNQNHNNVGPIMVEIGPCAPPTCSLSFDGLSPGEIPEINKQFKVRLSVTNNGGSKKRPISPKARLNVMYPDSPSRIFPETHQFPSLKDGDSHVFSGRSPNGYMYTEPGKYPMSGKISQTGAPGTFGTSTGISCLGSFNDNGNTNLTLGNKPYFKVYGNDIATGARYEANLGDKCTTSTLGNPKSTILSWADTGLPWNEIQKQNLANLPPTAEQWGGASTELAVFALGEIMGFYSASQHNPRRFGAAGSEPNVVTDLTFGNYNGKHGSNYRISTLLGEGKVPSEIIDESKVISYGGRSGMPQCISRYGDVEPAAASGNTTLNALVPGAPDNAGVVVVDGNVTITGSKQYTRTTWNGASDVSSFTLIVKGNIYIQPGVQVLDGTYIAMPRNDGSGGTIYTCANGNGNNPSFYPNPYSTCNQKLTFNGAVIAKQMKLGRTNGTLSNAAPPAPPQIGFKWVTAGKDEMESKGYTCVQFNEPEDPNTWDDNYLCSPRNLNLSFSSEGKISGQTCIGIAEVDSKDPNPWGNNYLCGSARTMSDLGLEWKADGPKSDKYCTLINEPSERGTIVPDYNVWDDNYLCETLRVPPAVAPETYSSNGAAEVFNASPEIYLNPPDELRKNTNGNFDYITSLPPLL